MKQNSKNILLPNSSQNSSQFDNVNYNFGRKKSKLDIVEYLTLKNKVQKVQEIESNKTI